MKKIILTLVMLFVSLYGTEYYGIDMNKKFIDNENCKLFQNGILCKDKNDIFDTVLLKITNKGLPHTIMLFKDFNSDRKGNKTISFYNKIKESLQNKYKEITSTEYKGSKFYISNFCYGIRKNENRYLTEFKDKENTDIKLVILKGENTDDCKVAIRYKINKEIIKEKKKEKKSLNLL